MNPREQKKKAKPKKKVEYQPKGSLYKYIEHCKITFKTVMNEADSCCDEFISQFKLILDNYGTDFGDLSFKQIIDICIANPKWLDWLDDNDFIEKEILMTLSVGDMFKIGDDSVILSTGIFGGELFLVSLTSGEQLHGAISYEGDPTDIEDIDTIFQVFSLNQEDDDDIDELNEILSTRIPRGSKITISKKNK